MVLIKCLNDCQGIKLTVVPDVECVGKHSFIRSMEVRVGEIESNIREKK